MIFFLPEIRTCKRCLKALCLFLRELPKEILTFASGKCCGLHAGQMTLFLISNDINVIKLSFAILYYLSTGHNSISLLRFPRGEGVKKYMNNELFIILCCICNSNQNLFLKKYSTVLSGSNSPISIF